MKNHVLLFALSALMVLFSCKKEEDPSPYESPYTKETVEESKANVENNAIALVDELDGLSSATGIEVMMNLNNISSTSNELKSTASSSLMRPMAAISSDAKTIFAELQSAEQALAEDPLGFHSLLDSIEGKYTYDPDLEDFVRTDLNDKVIIEFPGKETDVTNTATLTIDNYTYAVLTSGEYSAEYPKSLTIDVAYNGTNVAGASFVASWNNEGMPTKVSVKVYIDDFSYTTTATHSPYSSASIRNTLKHADDILLEAYVSATGNWSAENIDENTNTTYDDYGYSDTEVDVEEIIRGANAHLILMNLQVVGEVNIKALGDEIKALEDEYEDIEENQVAAQAAVDAINTYAKLVVIYRDSNTKIAEAEAYLTSRYDPYYEGTIYEPSMRFVYADGSVVDVESYVDEELTNFYDSVNAFIDQLNAEYDLDIDHVDPTPEPVYAK